MVAAHVKTEILESLKQQVVGEDLHGAEPILLTPYLALACSLLYMMAIDGELEEQESSQLQAVLGGDRVVLSYALQYVQSVPVDQFFAVASELLSVNDKWCILTNVCDALLADGNAERTELALFAKMSTAFGVHESQFEPYFKILAFKNDKSILGQYSGVREQRQPMTPHFALAIALLYMLTADGSIGAQEVGQLEAVIGEFDNLQNVALRYVRSVKLSQFLDEASAALKIEQKLYILTNVCDSMLSDGEVAHLEDKLFLSMLTAFGFTEKSFARYYQVLETKNFKPFDTREFKNHVSHERSIANEESAGITLKHQLTDTHTAAADFSLSTHQGVRVNSAGDAGMGQFIARTMEGNIQSVSQDFENQDNVIKVGLNATDGLNLQKIQTVQGAPNCPCVDVAEQSVNRQKLVEESASVHLQTTDVSVQDPHDESLSLELRMQNIQEVVEEVSHRLDRFEMTHFRFLQVGRTYKFTDAFAPIEGDGLHENRRLLEASNGRREGGVLLSNVTSTHASPSQEREEKLSAHVPTSEGLSQSTGDARQHVHQSNPRWWTSRGRGFVYVQLLVASCSMVFAAPIETRSVLRRSVVGPLLTLPVLGHAPINSSELLEMDGALVFRENAP